MLTSTDDSKTGSHATGPRLSVWDLNEAKRELEKEGVYATYLALYIDASDRGQLPEPWLKRSACHRSVLLAQTRLSHARWKEEADGQLVTAGSSEKERMSQLSFSHSMEVYTVRLYEALMKKNGKAISFYRHKDGQIQTWLDREKWIMSELHLYAMAFGR